MAIVLPDGILTNSSFQYVRDFIIENSQILAVVTLPQFAFTHFGAAVKSFWYFLDKRERKKSNKLSRIYGNGRAHRLRRDRQKRRN